MLEQKNNRQKFETKPNDTKGQSMSFAKPESKRKDEFEFSIYCSVDGCGRRWAVHCDGEKPKCSHHQWQNSRPQKKAFTSLPDLKPKTVTQWYEDKDEF